MTGNRISSPFFLNDHFVASMSPSLKLSLLEDRIYVSASSPPPTSVSLAEETDSTVEPVIWADSMRLTRWWLGKCFIPEPDRADKARKHHIIHECEDQNSGVLQCDVGQPMPCLCRPDFLFVLRFLYTHTSSWLIRGQPNGGSAHRPNWTGLAWLMDIVVCDLNWENKGRQTALLVFPPHLWHPMFLSNIKQKLEQDVTRS